MDLPRDRRTRAALVAGALVLVLVGWSLSFVVVRGLFRATADCEVEVGGRDVELHHGTGAVRGERRGTGRAPEPRGGAEHAPGRSGNGLLRGRRRRRRRSPDRPGEARVDLHPRGIRRDGVEPARPLRPDRTGRSGCVRTSTRPSVTCRTAASRRAGSGRDTCRGRRTTRDARSTSSSDRSRRGTRPGAGRSRSTSSPRRTGSRSTPSSSTRASGPHGGPTRAGATTGSARRDRSRATVRILEHRDHVHVDVAD